MYWLIGSLIIIVMMGVLDIAGTMLLPVSPLISDFSVATLPLFLMVLTVILIIACQRYVPFAPKVNAKTPFSQKSSVQNSINTSSYTVALLFKLTQYLLLVALALTLITGSGLLALINHQQAENSKIVQPLRVQALVTIEGISDSVYDVTNDSGYRQVATISQITPLVSELSTQDLNGMMNDYIIGNKNSLSKKESSNSALSIIHNQDLKYRVLLNAYPKKPSKKQSKQASKNASNQHSANKSSKDSQLNSVNYLQPGDQLFMSLTLAPLATSEQAINNPTGFDSYRWLRARHIDGVANILAVSTSTIHNVKLSKLETPSQSYLQRFRTSIDQGRWQLRQHFYKHWEEKTTTQQQASAVTLSLLTGDRSLINSETKDLYQLAGISHLLAISGTHVLFLAIVLAGAAGLMFDRLWPVVYRYIPRWQVRWWAMIGAAFIYALFTGFDVPAARTAWMLLAIGLMRLTLLPVSTMRVLFALAVLMAWHDPYVLWQAGYWLSFIAVALLLKFEDDSYRYKQTTFSNFKTSSDRASLISTLSKRVWIIGARIFKLQFWLFLTLLPITLLLFGKASLWGLVINLFAIGLFGWVIVPLNLLAGLCYLLFPALADAIWALVSSIVTSLHELMTGLTSIQILSEAWLYTPVNIAILLMVLLSILPWLLPRGFISRWLALAPFSLLMMTVYANQQSLATIPTLYILPTSDRYLSAALLQYPINTNENNNNNNNNNDNNNDNDNPHGQSLTTDKNKKNVSWLLLTDHRETNARALPSRLTPDKLSALLEQQLGSLAVDKLEGIIVQSSSVGLADKMVNNNDNQYSASNAQLKGSELLPMTVAQLNQRLPVNQYWQAGRSDRWPAVQQTYKVTSQSKSKSNISAQRCEQGKRWQLMNGELSIQALTGWSKVGDISVWDCTVAIDSLLPIRVLNYNASSPLKSLPAIGQTLTSNNQSLIQPAKTTKSRLILNVDTHQRVWQMWELLCLPELSSQENIFNNVTWLGHSMSHITADVLTRQKVNQAITYDDKPLEVALSLGSTFKDGEAEP